MPLKRRLNTLSIVISLCYGFLYSMNKPDFSEPELYIKSLSLRQKIAQLCVVAAVSDEEKNQDLLERWKNWQPLYCLKTEYVKKLVAEYEVGGVIFYGRNTLPNDQKKFTEELQELSSIPLLVAIDAEFGLGYFYNNDKCIKFPASGTVGATRDPELAYAMAYEMGMHLAALGFNMNFAPVVDVNCNPDNPIIGCRSFGSDPKVVGMIGTAVTKGLQDAGVLACAKHFPGHGDTYVDSHVALPVIDHDLERLENVELYPFQTLIQAGVKSIMLAHLLVNEFDKDKPSSLSYPIVTDLLKNKMQFEGLVITDALGMKATADYAPPGELEVKALEAGVDILLCPVNPIKAIEAVEQAVKEGRLSEKDIDEKVIKVLRAKKWITEHTLKDTKPLDEVLLNERAQDIRRQIYARAITLVKGSHDCNQRDDQSLRNGIIALSEKPTSFGNLCDELQLPYVRLPYNIDQDEVDTIVQCFSSDTIIISIHNPYFWRYSKHKIPKGIISLIKKYKELGKKVTVIYFGSPYSVTHLQDADTVILGYEEHIDTCKAVIDILMGKQKAEGKIPV